MLQRTARHAVFFACRKSLKSSEATKHQKQQHQQITTAPQLLLHDVGQKAPAASVVTPTVASLHVAECNSMRALHELWTLRMWAHASPKYTSVCACMCVVGVAYKIANVYHFRLAVLIYIIYIHEAHALICKNLKIEIRMQHNFTNYFGDSAKRFFSKLRSNRWLVLHFTSFRQCLFLSMRAVRLVRRLRKINEKLENEIYFSI